MTAQPPELEHLREDVDRIDRDIIDLLAQRRRVSLEMAKTKRDANQAFHDGERELVIANERLKAAEELDLDASLVARLWREIVDDSLRLQHDFLQHELNAGQESIVAAFQGIEGAYSHLAAQQFFESKPVDASYLGCQEFKDVVAAVEEGRADVAVLPVENTTSGAISEVYDLLMHSRLALIGETNFRVHHCLLGLEGADPAAIRTVYCHPQAVAQCSEFVASLDDGVQIVYFGDTARSGRWIKELDDPTAAAIASEEAAQILGLEVLRDDISNRDENRTRFLFASRNPITVDPQIPTKTSIVMAVGNRPGALLDALACFRDEDINLVKLESRPVPRNPWEEMFYIDFDGNLSDAAVDRALAALRRTARFVKVLGTYPSRDLRPRAELPTEATTPPPTTGRDATDPPTQIPEGYRLASRHHKDEQTTIEVGKAVIGGPGLVLIAGPCAVETEEQVMACAEIAAEHGAYILRGGCFKPRTSPYSFQGLGFDGLDLLAKAGKAVGLPIVTEVLAPEHVDRIAEQADILQIGARNMQNFTLLSAVGHSHRPVMLKRGMSSSLDELLQAAEYILAAGNQQVFLCERGIRTFETSTRNTLDISAVPVLRQRTHLPVIVDPSHAAGDRSLVTPLALAAKAVGAQGLMVEIHPNPDEALSDGPQSLDFERFEALVVTLS